jgi:hypothetical protein
MRAILPLPTRLETAVLPALRPHVGETPIVLAARVHTAMQDAMDELTEGRRWLLGRPRPQPGSGARRDEAL